METLGGSGGGFYLSTGTGISMVLGLTACITFLFKLLISSKDETIKTKEETIVWLRTQLEMAMTNNERAVSTSEKLVQKVRKE